MLGHIVHAAFALLMLVTYQPAGALHLLVESGNEVLIDGRSAGYTSDAAGGFLLDWIAVGEHEILIKTPEGATVPLKVRIADGELTTVQVSSLGLHAGRPRGTDSTIIVEELKTGSRRCTLAVDEASISDLKDQLKLEKIAPGKHTVLVICGSSRASSEMDIPSSAIVRVVADFESGRVRNVNEKPRAPMISVPTPADDIMALDLPLTWKRAIAGSLVSGIHVETVRRDGDGDVLGTFTAPSWDALEDFVRGLKRQDEVRRVETIRYGWIPNGIRFRILITFRTPNTV